MALAFLRVETRVQVLPHQEIPARVCVNRIVVCYPTHRPAAARPDWWVLDAIAHFQFVRRIRSDLIASSALSARSLMLWVRVRLMPVTRQALLCGLSMKNPSKVGHDHPGGPATYCCPCGPHRRATVAGPRLVGGAVRPSQDAKSFYRTSGEGVNHSRCCVCVDHENAVCPWRMRAPSSAISFQLGLTAPDP